MPNTVAGSAFGITLNSAGICNQPAADYGIKQAGYKVCSAKKNEIHRAYLGNTHVMRC